MFQDIDRRTKVKICGITNLEDARFAAGAMADYIGFIFYEKSERYIEPAKAGAIINWIGGLETVGVFVNSALDEVNRIVSETGVDLVQLHGRESPDYCRLIEKPVVKAIHIRNELDQNELQDMINSYTDVADYFLFDTKVPGKWGGSGKVFNWEIINKLELNKPFFLSGGLNSSNIRSAVTAVNPYAVDLSSGIEKAPGLKDFDKIESFFSEMRSVWEQQEMDEI